jgi:hypothetical protein
MFNSITATMFEGVDFATTAAMSSIPGLSAQSVMAWCGVQLPMAARVRQRRGAPEYAVCY